MKKLFSISFLFLILLSGMHLSIATHLCEGEVAAVKWSFSGEKATCGMENPKQSCPIHNSIASDCCKNEVVVYSVDNNYNPSSLQIKETDKNLLQVFAIPESISIHPFASSNCLYTNISPQDKLLASAVRLADICVFRI